MSKSINEMGGRQNTHSTNTTMQQQIISHLQTTGANVRKSEFNLLHSFMSTTKWPIILQILIYSNQTVARIWVKVAVLVELE